MSMDEHEHEEQREVHEIVKLHEGRRDGLMQADRVWGKLMCRKFVGKDMTG